MDAFMERLLNEKSELDEKKSKLEIFVKSESFNKVPEIQKSLLRIQLESMNTYSQCLFERISWIQRSIS